MPRWKDRQPVSGSSRKLLCWMVALTGLVIVVFLGLHVRLMRGFSEQVNIQRRQSLIHVVSIARNAVEPILSDFRAGRITEREALLRVRALVRTMTYEDQYGRNYVFMSAWDGTMLVQPFEPGMELSSQWDLRDDRGRYIIRELARSSQQTPSGSFLSYHYHLPGLHTNQEKLAYVVGLPELKCYIGTGMYLQKAILEQEAVLHRMRWAGLGLAGLVILIAGAAIAVIFQRNRQLSGEVESRRRAEHALSIREARYRELVENARTIILRWDQEGRILFLNEFGENLFGWPEGESVGRTVMETIVPGRETTGRDLADMIRRITEDPEAFVTNVNENISRDGRRFWILWKNRPIFDENGNLREILSVGSDITALRAAEDALRENERRFEAGTRAARLGTWEFNIPENRFTLSAEWTRILGDGPLPRTRNDIMALVHPEDHTAVLQTMRRAIEDGRPYEIEHRFIRPGDGGVRTVRVYGEAVLAGDRTPLRLFGAVMDITGRKETEEALDSQLRLMSTLLDNLPIGIFMVEAPSGRPLVANERARYFLGRGILPDANRENLGEVYEAWRYGAGERYPLEEMPIIRGMYGETSRVEDMEVVRPDGSRILLEVHGCPVRDATGNVAASLVSFMDITGRIRGEEALRFNTDRLETLLKLNQMGHLPLREITDFALEGAVRLTGSRIGYLAFMNEDETEMTMYSWSREAMRECAIEDKPIHYPVMAAGLWGEAVRQRKPLITNNYDDPNPWKRGCPEGHVKLTRHLNVPVFSGDHIVLVAGVGNKNGEYTEDDVRQLTLLMEGMWSLVEHKRDAEALLERERHLNLITDSVPAIIAHIGADRRFILVNRAYTDFFRLPPEAIVGHHVREIVGERAYAVSEPYMERVMTGEIVEFENRGRDGLGRERDLVLNYVPDFDSAERVTGYFALITDITDRKRAEAERLDMERHLLHAQKLESLGVLAGGIAHDFNNLLAAILGNLEMSLVSLSPSSLARPDVEESIRITRRAADLTRQMLAYSGKGRFMVRPLDLSELVRENAHMLRSAVSRTVKLNLRLGENLPPVPADAGQVQQVIMNLIINAAEAIGDRDGAVTISTERVECDAHRLARSRLDEKAAPGWYVVLEVADTGCGMSGETQERLFDPFFTTKFTGRGLGMSAVLGIVRGHRGAIEVESEPGAGSVIRVLFPAVESEWQARSAAMAGVAGITDRDAPDFALSGAVLVVDDEESVRDITVRILKRWKIRTLEAADGIEAVERFREHAGDISLVLLDLTMPRLDGAATFAEIARIRPDTPIILCSGYTEQDARTRFADTAFAGYLEKPFDMRTLRKELERALTGREKERPES